MTLQERLKEAIKKSGIKPIELSRQTGIPISSLSRYINHNQGISYKHVDAIINFCEKHALQHKK